MKSTAFKILTGFILGATVVGGFAIANPFTTPVVKACVDNKTKALYISSNGSCPKGRSAIDIGATGANVKSIAQLVSPSVVSIEVTAASGSGTGSGSIYKSNANNSFIITNNHVIETAAVSGQIEVELNNGDVLPATIIGRNSDYDLAIISIKKGNLPEIAIGNSSSLSIGDPVIAFGSPLGLSGTVTSGIVSALNRPVTTGSLNAESFMDAIQTDAAINPGNSGGPLVDSTGAVIGVNSAIATLGSSFGSQSGSIGLGFAIPINQARKTADQLIKNGKATYPVLGIAIDMKYEGDGALISKSEKAILSGGPAALAGLKGGDIITKFDGRTIYSAEELIVAIRAKSVGDKAVLTYIRGGVTSTATVTLQAGK